MRLAQTQAKRWLWIALGAVLASVLILWATGQIQAQEQPSAEVLACQQPRTGIIIVVTDQADCPTDWNPLTWNVEGIQGEQGLQGEQGPAGPDSPKSINLPITGANLGGDALFQRGGTATAGIHLSGGQIFSFASFAFTLPSNYGVGDPVTARLMAQTVDTGCNAVLSPDFLSVNRLGQAAIVGDTAAAGLEIVTDTLSATQAKSVSHQLEYLITSPDLNTPLEPGDSIIFGFARDPFLDTDTCTEDLILTGVTVTYGAA